jgi:hypothetical protein
VKQQTEDREHNLRFDLGRSLQLAGMPLEMKFGAKFSRRKKTNDSEVWQYEDLDNAPSLAASTDGEVSYGLGRFGPRISRGAVQGFIDGLNRGDYYNEEESRVNDFTLHEDINAGYLQGTLKPGCGAFSAACVTKAPASAPAAPGSTMARLSPTR